MAVPGHQPIGSACTEFPGGSFNALVDDYWRRRGQKPASAFSNFQTAANSPALVISARNSSGGDLKVGNVLGLDSPLITYANDGTQVYSRPSFKGITPTTDDHADKFCVLIDWIESTKVGSAVILGSVWAKLNVIDSDHTHAKVKDGDASQLDSADTGPAVIVWKESGTGEDKWALILLGGSGSGSFSYTAAISSVIGEGTAAVPVSGDAIVYRVAADGSTTSLGTKTLWNPFEVPADNSVSCERLNTSNYLITGVAWTCSTIEVVTGLECVDDVVTATTEELTYVSGPCP